MDKLNVLSKTTSDFQLNRLLFGNLDYETFRSEICHMYKNNGDYQFISKVMTIDAVTYFWNREEYVKAFYVLAMIDYISWKNDVPLFEGYSYIRGRKLDKPIYPLEVILMDKLEHSDNNKANAMEMCLNDESGAFFIRHNIVEGRIWDVV